jgi:gluconolactonase
MVVDLVVFSDKIYDIVPQPCHIETVASGFEKTEGPVWVADEQVFFFTDFSAEKIYQWHDGDGLRVFREKSNRAVGMALDKKGCLIACEGITRRVTRTEKNGDITPVATHYKGKRLNSPNDVVVKSDGGIYFTDPRSRYLTDEQELDFNGVFKVDPTDGQVHLLTSEFQWPNGLCFSPDEMRLYINDSSRQHIKVFEVLDDGTVGQGRLFCELDKAYGKGAPDGMKVDAEGRVYVTGPGGVWVIDVTGEPLGIIKIPEGVLNIGFAGSTLYLTAQSKVLRIGLQVSGI